MAFINCPQCGKEISDKGEKCQFCSYPITTEMGPRSEDSGIQVEDEKCKKETGGTRRIITWSVSAIVILGIVIVFMLWKNTDKLIEYEWGSTKYELEESMKGRDADFMGDEEEYNIVGYKEHDIRCFEGCEVKVLYYFNGEHDTLKTVSYWLADQRQENIDEYISCLNKKYKQVKNKKSTIASTEGVTMEWENDTTSISYSNYGEWITINYTKKE